MRALKFLMMIRIMIMIIDISIAPIQICFKCFTKAKELKESLRYKNMEYNHDKNKINLRFYLATIKIFNNNKIHVRL